MNHVTKNGVLVITRKEKQSVTLQTKSGEIIKVYVTRIPNSYTTRLGFECEREVKVTRTEALEDNKQGS